MHHLTQKGRERESTLDCNRSFNTLLFERKEKSAAAAAGGVLSQRSRPAYSMQHACCSVCIELKKMSEVSSAVFLSYGLSSSFLSFFFLVMDLPLYYIPADGRPEEKRKSSAGQLSKLIKTRVKKRKKKETGIIFPVISPPCGAILVCVNNWKIRFSNGNVISSYMCIFTNFLVFWVTACYTARHLDVR